MYGYFDSSAETVVRELHEANAACNAMDIARMRAIVRCDLKRVYRRDDSFDMAKWLAVELGISSWKASRLMTAAYALDELPLSAAAYERGELSTDQFVELARLATRASEGKLLAWAKRSSPAAIRARADRERRIEPDETKEAVRSRSLEWEWDQDGSRLALWGSLPTDDGARFIAAVERQARRMPLPQETEGETATQDARRADALVAMASAWIASDPVPDKATIVVHTDVDGILDGDKNGVLHGGLPLPPEATELLACDSKVQTVLHDDDGGMFHISSPSYVVPARIRRQVEHRDDYRCTFPGCGTKAFTDVHHIVPWPKGPSQPSNLVVVCRTHHRLVHVFGWHVKLKPEGATEWFKPDWTPYEPRPAPKPAVL